MAIGHLTLFCDASHCPNTKIGGWGAWAKRDDWTHGKTFGAALKGTVNSASEAELAGIVNAMHLLHADGSFESIKVVMIQCDNIRALELIHTFLPGVKSSHHRESVRVVKRDTTRSPFEKLVMKRLEEIVTETKLELRVRHVRGHKGTKTGRQWVNTVTDKIAGDHMRKRRAQLHGGEYGNEVSDSGAADSSGGGSGGSAASAADEPQ